MYATIILFISGGEIFFIMFIVVMVFGADKIPGIAKSLGKGMRQLKDATEDIKQEIQKSAEKQGIDTSFVQDIKKDLDDVKKNVSDVATNITDKQGIDTSFARDIKKDLDEVKKKVGDVTGTIKRK
ncbi:MAG TPA: twin-arginine translocase TatA/TatE family subunit [Eudoraea sp.]|nr:twin-arginine translocase TatA/TatE family subunit [Eudoraea sp.]